MHSFKHNTSFVSRLSTIRRHKPVAPSVSQLSALQLAATPPQTGRNLPAVLSDSATPMASITEQVPAGAAAAEPFEAPASRRASIKSTVSAASLSVMPPGESGSAPAGEQLAEGQQQQRPIRAILRNRLLPSAEAPPGGQDSSPSTANVELPTFTYSVRQPSPAGPAPTTSPQSQQQAPPRTVCRSVGYEPNTKRNSDGKLCRKSHANTILLIAPNRFTLCTPHK